MSEPTNPALPPLPAGTKPLTLKERPRALTIWHWNHPDEMHERTGLPFEGPLLLQYEATLRAREEQVRVLRQALQALYDEQNGPPLSKYAKDWHAAIELARAALAATQEG